MYPRLRLARNLLKDDGVIFISIDEVEVNNLKQVANEIFGETNFVGQFIWSAGKKNDSKLVSISHEYILVYLKSSDKLKLDKTKWRTRKKGLDDIYKKYQSLVKEFSNDFLTIESELKKWFKALSDDNPAKRHKHYSSVDSKGIYFPDNISWPGGGGPKYEVLHPTTKKPVSIPSRGWLYGSIEKMNALIKDDKIVFGQDENNVPCIKAYLKDREYEVPYSVFYLDGRASSKRLRTLMGGDYFDHPKDELLLEEVMDFVDLGDEIIIDFFSGSGTIAESSINYNLHKNKKSRYILVQLPQRIEDITATSAKQKKKQKLTLDFLKKHNKPSLLSELGKERIRRVAKKIAQGHPEKAKDLDLGFKVFKLDTSNIKGWDGNPDNLDDSLFDAQDNIKTERTEHDVLYEILLKYGLDLTLPIEEKSIESKTVFSVGYGALFICLADDITSKVAEGIGKWKEQLQPEVCRVVFKDSGFTDVDKTNSVQTLKRFGITEIKSI
jgi:adenine-specific DNA-methyltransferase